MSDNDKPDNLDTEKDPDTFNPGADDDDEPYYEVEKIVSMHVKENGVRMFELKWKNYPDRCENTWEPEEHLSCETLLQEYLAANNYAQAQFKDGFAVNNAHQKNAKSKRKKKVTNQQQSRDEVGVAESSQAGTRREEARLREEARQRELDEHERQLEALDAAEQILENAEKQKKKKSKGKKKAQENEVDEDDEIEQEAEELLERNKIPAGIAIKEPVDKNKTLTETKRKEKEEEQRRKEQEEERNRSAEERRKEQEEKERQETLEKQQRTARKMKELREKNEADRREREERQKEADRREREERQKRIEEAYLQQQQQKAASEAAAFSAAKKSIAAGYKPNNTNHITATTSTASISSNSSSVDSSNDLSSHQRTKPSIRLTFDKNNIGKAAAESSSSSFGKIKRNNNQNVAPVAALDLQNLVSKISQPKYPNNNTNQRPKLAISTNHTTTNNTSLQSPYFSILQSAVNPSLQSPLLQQQQQQQPLQSPQPQQQQQLNGTNATTAVRQPPPSIVNQSPPINHQSPPSNTPSPSPPNSMSNGSAPMEWQTAGLIDPRRQRLAEAGGRYAPDQPQSQQNTSSVATVATSASASHLEGLTVKRQTSRDPRMRAENVKKRKLYNATAVPTPFEIDSTLYNGNKFVATIRIEGKQNCYHESKIRYQIANVGKSQVRIMYTLPLKALNTILSERPVSYMSISPLNHIVDLSKLKSFYQVNEMAGIVHHSQESQAMVVLAEADMKKLTNLSPDISLAAASHPQVSQVCALFIDGLIPRPISLAKEIEYEVFDPSTDNITPYSWNRVADYLKFPAELSNLKSKAEFNIYGSSDTYHILKKASYSLKTIQSNTSSYVMMFDRYNDEVFKKDLYRHKRNASTQIWEFGVPDFSYGEMIPAAQVFPNNTGGFVTTDMENVVHNVLIIDDIAHQIHKLNQLPMVYGEWKFILPHNWLKHLRLLVKDVESGMRVQNAVIAIALALSNETIQILKIWSTETEEMNYVQFMDRIAHEKYKTHQYFVYVDDISSASPYKQSKNYSVDFIQSHKIFSDYS